MLTEAELAGLEELLGKAENHESPECRTAYDRLLRIRARNALPSLLAAARENANLHSVLRGRMRDLVNYDRAVDNLASDLLATRRELARARARAVTHLSDVWHNAATTHALHGDRKLMVQCQRAARLCRHYARKFEAEAERIE
jgi:hypothetical protein